MDIARRDLLRLAAVGGLWALAPTRSAALAQTPPPAPVDPSDRVFITNEDSSTISVIDPRSNTVDTTINLTSFDEDPRPAFRFAGGGSAPTPGAMIARPLYHGAIGVHGLLPSPDGRWLATTARGSGNVYVIDTLAKKVLGGGVNPQAVPSTNPERLSSGILVGREPLAATFTRNGKELWVAVGGEDRIAIIETAAALKESGGGLTRAVRGVLQTINGPSRVWFSADGGLAFIASQKTSTLAVLAMNPDADGFSRPSGRALLTISAQDPLGCTPFLKTSPDGAEVWCSHKLADRVSAWETREPFRILDGVGLGQHARPNHLEFVENARGKVVYVSLARVDDGGPGGLASSQIAIIDRAARAGARRVASTFFTRGREAHGLWTNPTHTLLYVAHEQDEPPGAPNAGQAVASAFDVSNPFVPAFLGQIPLGELALPSGRLRNKKSIDLVYVRPGARSQSA
jgi:YVTN family beta-propeller protein